MARLLRLVLRAAAGGLAEVRHLIQTSRQRLFTCTKLLGSYLAGVFQPHWRSSHRAEVRIGQEIPHLLFSKANTSKAYLEHRIIGNAGQGHIVLELVNVLCRGDRRYGRYGYQKVWVSWYRCGS